MIVVLAGAGGFFGDALRRACLSAGLRVRAVVRDPARLRGRGHPRLELFRGDVARPEALAKACVGADVFVDATRCETRDEAAHVAATLAAVRGYGVPAAVAVGSSFVFGPTDHFGSASERTRPMPADFVLAEQRSKLAARRAVAASRVGGFRAAVVHPAPLLGPLGAAPSGIVARLFAAVERRGVPAFPSNLGRRIGLVHVEDAARAVASLILNGVSDDEFLLSGEAATFETLIGAASGGRPLPRRLSPTLLRGALAFAAVRRMALGAQPVDTGELIALMEHDWVFDAGKAERLLGASFRPLVDSLQPAVVAADQGKSK